MSRRLVESLYLTDAEIAARVGVSTDKWKAAVDALKGLPPADPVFEFRRYWPAVKAYLDRRNGVAESVIPQIMEAEENWNGKYGRRPLRAGQAAS